MSTRAPRGRLVRAASHVLPAGELRERYRQEFLADLYDRRRAARLRCSLGVLMHVVLLRIAVGWGIALEFAAFGGRRSPCAACTCTDFDPCSTLMASSTCAAGAAVRTVTTRRASLVTSTSAATSSGGSPATLVTVQGGADVMNHAMSRMGIRAATITLPAGAVRERDRQEFLADLYEFDRRARLAFAFGIWTTRSHCARLRAATLRVAERDFSTVRKPLSCRLHLHFRVRCVNADGTSTTVPSLRRRPVRVRAPPGDSGQRRRQHHRRRVQHGLVSSRDHGGHQPGASLGHLRRGDLRMLEPPHHQELTRPIHTAPRADVSRSS